MADPDFDSFLVPHLDLLRSSYRRWTGRELAETGVNPREAAEFLDSAPFGLLSHDTRPDPVFNYGNRLALSLFEMDWEKFTSLPSRLSAEPVNREERARLLEAVTRHGFVDDYSGVRISATGRRFMIGDATVWNLVDDEGNYRGQAALIRNWEDL